MTSIFWFRLIYAWGVFEDINVLLPPSLAVNGLKTSFICVFSLIIGTYYHWGLLNHIPWSWPSLLRQFLSRLLSCESNGLLYSLISLAGADTTQGPTHPRTLHIISVAYSALYIFWRVYSAVAANPRQHMSLCRLNLWGFVILILVVLGVYTGVSVSAGLRFRWDSGWGILLIRGAGHKVISFRLVRNISAFNGMLIGFLSPWGNPLM